MLLEFGLRRAQGVDGGVSASRYAYLGGFDATRAASAGRQFGIPIKGARALVRAVALWMGLREKPEIKSRQRVDM